MTVTASYSGTPVFKIDAEGNVIFQRGEGEDMIITMEIEETP